MRAFVRLRDLLVNNEKLRRKLNDLEKKYDQQFKVVFEALRQLMIPPASKQKRKMGFIVDLED